MDQLLFISIDRRDCPPCKQMHPKLLGLYGGDALSYSEVCYWSRQFLMGREYVEDAGRTERLLISVFSFEIRVR
jgi:hypothetical protein